MTTRREFITLLGGAAATWPLAARGQQPPSVVRHIGVLSTGFPNMEAARSFLDPFRQGLREFGWIEGQRHCEQNRRNRHQAVHHAHQAGIRPADEAREQADGKNRLSLRVSGCPRRPAGAP
jgi:hypothetical protein